MRERKKGEKKKDVMASMVRLKNTIEHSLFKIGKNDCVWWVSKYKLKPLLENHLLWEWLGGIIKR